MNRRQLAFLVLVNAVISLAISLLVAWAVEARRPDPEELLALANQQPTTGVLTLATPTTAPVALPATVTEPIQEQPTAAPTIAATTAISGEQQIYIVQAGDSLGSIAEKFGVGVSVLIAVNELKNPDFVFSGQRLVIPAKGATAAPAPTAGSGNADNALILKISQVQAPGNLVSEAVQIINDGKSEVNLSGWRLERAQGPIYTFGNVVIFSGSAIWLHSTEGQDTTIALYWKQSAPVWSSGAQVQLLNPEGNVVANYQVP